MKVEYANRALSDLRKISADSRRAFGENVAAALAARIRATVEQISREPMGAPELEQRSEAHVVVLVRYPYKIFYRVFEDRVRIQHVRHTARRSWEGE
jgi:plasmid stabilization system protein ParE